MLAGATDAKVESAQTVYWELPDVNVLKMCLLACVFTAMAACGDPADIPAGKYRVAFEAVKNPCNHPVESVNVDIEEIDESIRVIFSADTTDPAVYNGAREGARIVARRSEVAVSCYEITADLELKAKGDGFVGTLNSDIYYCDSGVHCFSEFKLTGQVR